MSTAPCGPTPAPGRSSHGACPQPRAAPHLRQVGRADTCARPQSLRQVELTSTSISCGQIEKRTVESMPCIARDPRLTCAHARGQACGQGRYGEESRHTFARPFTRPSIRPSIQFYAPWSWTCI
eukprot:353292-Chlamydomonas_euryale.AAC.1